MESIKDRFLRYVKVHTMSKPGIATVPSTPWQFDLARMLETELKAMGIKEVELDDFCFLTAKIPSNLGEEVTVPAIGFFAHVDTAPDDSGENVKPLLWENYDGGDIVLNEQITISPKIFPQLNRYVGDTIITADGTPLLGADDKTAVAELMYVAEYLTTHPEVKHGDIWLGFAPDEEIGLGIGKIDISRVKAEFGYTLDAEVAGELQNQTFNAAALKVKITGRQVHPASAKNKMINALHLIHEFDRALPYYQRPEYTDGEEGFYHLTSVHGEVAYAESTYIVREHNTETFLKRKALVEKTAEELQKQYPDAKVEIELSDTYYNILDVLKDKPEVVDIAKRAMEALGIEVEITAFRGGTDGSVISRKGIPCPNIFAGWHNGHGKYEYTTVGVMDQAAATVLKIIELVVEENA